MLCKRKTFILLSLLAVLWDSNCAIIKRQSKRDSLFERENPHSIEDVQNELRRLRRSTGDPSYTKFLLNDTNTRGLVHYSGSDSKVVFVLTYQVAANQQVVSSNVYRSSNYGNTFVNINSKVGNGTLLSPTIITSPEDFKRVYFADASKSIIYLSTDEGLTFSSRPLIPSTIEVLTFKVHPTKEDYVLARDTTNNVLYVSTDFGKTPFTKIADKVYFSSDYQWGESPYDKDDTIVYYNVDSDSETTTEVYLYTQRYPYNEDTKKVFDSTLGAHVGFAIVDRYIFVQKMIDEKATLWVSADRQPFKQAKIPSNYGHLNYIVDSIRSLQALVIVQHDNDLQQFNLYMSEEQGILYYLALSDLKVTVFPSGGVAIDLEPIDSMNYTTYIANQNVRDTPTDTNPITRTLISFDVGANWDILTPPSSPDSECIQPLCSLHLHMSTSEYWRTGVYSQESAPGIIIAHGILGQYLNDDNTNLFISRDGGATWSMTLEGTWGVSVLDLGGLIIAAKDYHNSPDESRAIMYTCDEGFSWSELTFTNENVRVFGVITEPGETTSISSLYGVESSGWVVVTIDFANVFPRMCSTGDYYNWTLFDENTDTGCLLGASVAIQRRRPSVCCQNGKNYTRNTSYSVCPCSEEDFECDYGYKHANGYSGACVRDEAVTLDDPCSDGDSWFMESQGYHKIGGDVCSGGVEEDYTAVQKPCCNSPSSSSSSSKNTPIILGSFVLVALVVIGVMAVVLVACVSMYKSRGTARGGGYRVVPPTYEPSSPEEDMATTGVGVQNINYQKDDDRPLTP